jgi:hypothetical protein
MFPSLRLCLFFPALAILALPSVVLPLCAQEETAEAAPVVARAKLITPAEARALAETELAHWRERTAGSRPRTYFTADTWASLRTRYAAASGRERELFDAVIERARDLAGRPVVVYRPPEDYVSPKISMPTAQAELWERPVGDDLITASLALALVDDDGLREHLRRVVLPACAYPTWGRGPTGDLACAHLLRGVSIAYDWHPAMWAEEERSLIIATVRRHAADLAEGLYGKAFWALAYDNNHNHVSTSALGLAGLAFLDEIPEAPEWLAASRLNFERALPANSADGSTPEGVTYWAYSLNFILQYIEGTRQVAGTDALYKIPFLREAANFRIHASTSGFGAPLPWGDVGGAVNSGFIFAALARQYRLPEAQFLTDESSFRQTSGAPIDTIAWLALWRDPSLAGHPPETLDHHFNASDIVTTRDGWTDENYVLSIKSGVNNRNHGHLDAGALALAYGSEWLLTSSRYGTGKSDGTGGFWDRGTGRRWTYFSCATESQSTLLIDGRNQRFDAGARATIDRFASEGSWCWTSVDLHEAYAGVDSARREVLHRRGDYILVFDHLDLATAGTVEWLAQMLPGATAKGPRLNVAGNAGSLELRALLPTDATFARRKATSPHYDVPPSRLESFSLSQRGRTVRYVVALLPAPKGRASPVQEIVAKDTPDGLLVTVRGEGWTDRVLLSVASVSASRDAGLGSAPDVFTTTRRTEPSR